MHVANLELCKELFELSGWGLVDDQYWDIEHFWSANGTQWLVQTQGTPTIGTLTYPAYGLGYLLRKLYEIWQLTQLSGGYTPNGWRAEKNISQDYPGHNKADANTPEDAVCKLAIELHKQGILLNSKEV